MQCSSQGLKKCRDRNCPVHHPMRVKTYPPPKKTGHDPVRTVELKQRDAAGQKLGVILASAEAEADQFSFGEAEQ